MSGIALTAVFAPNGWLGEKLASVGVQVAYTWIGVVVALILIGLPFVVRSVQPALIEVQRDLEDAAETLGQAPADLPPDHPARGAAGGPDRVYARLCARHRRVRVGGVHLGQPADEKEITTAPDRDQARAVRIQAAAALGLAMLVMSFVMLFAINLVQRLGAPTPRGAGR